MAYKIGQFKQFYPQPENVSFFRNAIVHWLLIGVIVLSVSAFAILLYFVHPSLAQIKLQYNLFLGTSKYGTWWQIYLLPITAFAFFIVDLLLAYMLYGLKERIGSYVLLLAAFFLHVALLIAIVGLILNNF